MKTGRRSDVSIRVGSCRGLQLRPSVQTLRCLLYWQKRIRSPYSLAELLKILTFWPLLERACLAVWEGHYAGQRARGRAGSLGAGWLPPSWLLSSSWQRLTPGSSSPCPRCCPWASPTKAAGSPGSCRPRTMTLGRRWTLSSIRSTRCDGFCPRSRPPSCLLVVLS